ncbi:MAG: class I SAM-dependent methyltransferase, partial [Gammaproteobacteria bacterium]|nr:class I SAM-dependent methyltransferase [Gammaproteobacteria bacterium]
MQAAWHSFDLFAKMKNLHNTNANHSMDIDQLLTRVRAAAEKIPLSEYPSPTPLTPTTLDLSQEETTSLSIQMLISIPQQYFLQESYRLLFARPIDSQGFNHYQGLLSDGYSRTEILYMLVHSPEGKRLGLKLRGLGWRSILCRWSLKYYKYIPPRIHSALYAGRGGLVGKLARLLPGGILRILLAPFWLNRLPRRWLKAWENTIRQPLAPFTAYTFVLQQDITQLRHKLSEVQQDAEDMINSIKTELATMQNTQAQLGHHLVKLEQTSQAQDKRQSAQEQTLAWLRYSLSHHWHRALLATSPTPSLSALPTDEQEEALDAFYIAFEDACRGSEEDIYQNLQVYLEPIQHSAAAQGYPIIDLGCGRGEWLRLLHEHGLQARGVDRSLAMVERARAYGLEVEQDDAVQALSRLPDASVGAVTGFHIIEHLPFSALFRLFAEAARVLVPNGMIIFETPNPENILVGSHTFYHDPTHRNPIT